MLVEAVELEFVALGVFAPRDEKAAAAGVVGVGEEAEPVEIGDGFGAFGQGAEKFVDVGGVVEGVALDEDGQVGEGVVALGEMVEIGVGFAAEVGEREGVRDAGAFVIDADGNFG